MQRDAKAEAFWTAYVATLADAIDAERRFYEVFMIGKSAEAANRGAALIKQGVKTATSSLLWAYEAAGKPLPEKGSLSIVTNGDGNPVCVIETSEVQTKGLREVDAAFAYDYGEWDRTLQTWSERCLELNTPVCHALGRTPSAQMPLVFERFTVVYP